MTHTTTLPLRAAALLALVVAFAPAAPLLPAAAAEEVSATPAAYIYRKGDSIIYYRDKIFTESGPQLVAPIILRFAGETVNILVAPSANMNLNEIVIENGREFLFNADGVMERENAFPTLTLNNTLGAESPGTFVEGRALIEADGAFSVCTIEEDRYGVRTLTLATNQWTDPRANSLHLYNGYQLSFGDTSEIERQLSFGEIAVNGKLTAPAPVYTGPTGGVPGIGLGNPTGSTLPPGVFLNGAGIYVDAAGNPIGRPVDVPRDTIKAPEVYARPAIKVIGVIPFKYEGKLGTEEDARSKATPELYAGLVTQIAFEALSKVEGIEVKILELAPEDQSGTYVMGFAKKIGQKYGCDAIFTGTIKALETTGDTRLDTQVKVIGKLEAALIDTTGGKFNWQNEGEMQRFVARSTYQGNSGSTISEVFSNIAMDMVAEMRSKKVFDARDI